LDFTPSKLDAKLRNGGFEPIGIYLNGDILGGQGALLLKDLIERAGNGFLPRRSESKEIR
jgi:hypothetical protein